MKEDIMVSIICNAYNHEKYIRDALESFVNQKTNFVFEILLHDDASTDKTPDIIREYENKYPELVKPIYQTENQYSKKMGLVGKIQYARVQGKYIAFCEGDDYWTDPYKLQKQYDAMEQHPEVDMCAHGAIGVNEDSKKIEKYICPRDEDGILSVEEIIEQGGGFIATNSLFYRSEINKNIPEFRKYKNFDYTIQMHGALKGGILYLSDIMSAYRLNSIGSWTVRNKNVSSQIELMDRLVNVLELLDEFTQHKYNTIIEKVIIRKNFQKKILLHDFAGIKKEPYLERYKALPLKRKVKFKLISILDFIKRR